MIFLLALLLNLEHAISPQQLHHGLMERTELAEHHGMLFHFQGCQRRTLWMYNCLIDLDVAFLDKEGVILEIYPMYAYPEETSRAFFAHHAIHSRYPAKYALEMPLGYFQRHQIKPGARLCFDSDSPQATLEN